MLDPGRLKAEEEEMRSRFVLTVLVTFFTFFSCKTHSQIANVDEVHPQQDKIGKVNIADVISSTRVGKKTLADVVKQFAAKQKELAKQEAEIDHLKQRFSDHLGKAQFDKERDQLSATIASKEEALDANKDQLREQREQAVNKTASKLGIKVLQVLLNYAKTNGYAAILDTGGPTAGILWASEGTVRRLGLTGKPQPEIEKGLLAAFADKQATLINQELIKACDAEIHSVD
jgi:Skp family chaperone for outer membrane proteins